MLMLNININNKYRAQDKSMVAGFSTTENKTIDYSKNGRIYKGKIS